MREEKWRVEVCGGKRGGEVVRGGLWGWWVWGLLDALTSKRREWCEEGSEGWWVEVGEWEEVGCEGWGLWSLWGVSEGDWESSNWLRETVKQRRGEWVNMKHMRTTERWHVYIPGLTNSLGPLSHLSSLKIESAKAKSSWNYTRGEFPKCIHGASAGGHQEARGVTRIIRAEGQSCQASSSHRKYVISGGRRCAPGPADRGLALALDTVCTVRHTCIKVYRVSLHTNLERPMPLYGDLNDPRHAILDHSPAEIFTQWLWIWLQTFFQLRWLELLGSRLEEASNWSWSLRMTPAVLEWPSSQPCIAGTLTSKWAFDLNCYI